MGGRGEYLVEGEHVGWGGSHPTAQGAGGRVTAGSVGVARPLSLVGRPWSFLEPRWATRRFQALR